MKTNTTKKPAQPPVARIRIGLISASIWERTGEKGSFYSVKFERRYRDPKGSWHSTYTYGEDDLLALSKLADQAHTTIAQLQAAKAE